MASVVKELNSAKELVKNIKDTLPATRIAFSTIVLRKDRQNINESRVDFGAKLPGLSLTKSFQANIYLFKVIKRNNRKRYAICSKLTIKARH